MFVPLQLVPCMSNSVNQHPTFWKVHLESPENVLELTASSCWVLRAGGVMKTECVQAFPVEKKWGSPITQDTQCLVTALSHYGLLMGLSLGKIAIYASMMDFSLIAEHDNGVRPFLLKFQGVENKHVWFEVAVSLLLLFFYFLEFYWFSVWLYGLGTFYSVLHMSQPQPYQTEPWSSVRYGRISVYLIMRIKTPRSG